MDPGGGLRAGAERPPAEMPSHSAETRARLGTVTTLIARSWAGRTLKRGRILDGDGTRPLTVTENVTLDGTVAGHDAPAGHRGAGEQPPAASTPASTAATRLTRTTPHHSASVTGHRARRRHPVMIAVDI